MKKAYIVSLACAIAIGVATSASAITVVNGGFETGDFTGFVPVTEAGGDAQVVSTSTASDGTVYSAFGNYMAELTTDAYILEGQTWAAGESFGFMWAWLGMDYMPYNDYSKFQIVSVADPSIVMYEWDLGSIAADGNFVDTGWQVFNTTFASAGTGTFKWVAYNSLDTALDSKLLIDAVGNPIPEPTTMLLFGTGLAGLAAVARRRRK